MLTKRALHVLIGTWVLIFYLLSTLTSLWWSDDWYRRAATYALTGEAVGKDRKDHAGAALPRMPIAAAICSICCRRRRVPTAWVGEGLRALFTAACTVWRKT